MKNIAKLTSYGCYLDCDFVTAKYPGDETHIVGNVAEYVYDLEQKIADLEVKLAEKDEQIERRVAVYEKNFIEQTDELYKLKQQLAEKDKEISELKRIGEKGHLNDLLEDKRKENKMLIKAIEQVNQDKISFAVEQLEKVLVLIHNAVNIDSPEYDLVGLYDAVSNQIKQLKEQQK